MCIVATVCIIGADTNLNNKLNMYHCRELYESSGRS